MLLRNKFLNSLIHILSESAIFFEVQYLVIVCFRYCIGIILMVVIIGGFEINYDRTLFWLYYNKMLLFSCRV
jgi:hypothetical protein